MRCADYLPLLDLPEALRAPHEQEALRRHLDRCPDCRLEAERLQATLTRFRETPDAPMPEGARGRFDARIDALLSPPDPLDATPAAGTHRSAGASRAPLSRTAATPGPPRRPHHLARLMSAAAALALLLTAGLLYQRQPATPDIKIKGDEAAGPPNIDLQASIEAADGSLTPAQDRQPLEPGSGLLFRFLIEGAPHLLLIERDPRHRLTVLYRTSLPSGDAAPRTVQLTNPAGRLLRYEPDGPGGEYVYIAVASRSPLDGTPAQLDALWNRYASQVIDPMGASGSDDLALDALRIRYTPQEGPALPLSPGPAGTASPGREVSP